MFWDRGHQMAAREYILTGPQTVKNPIIEYVLIIKGDCCINTFCR